MAETTASLPRMTEKALRLFDYLVKHPDSTRAEIEATGMFPPGETAFPFIVGHLRNKIGQEVLTCRYSRDHDAWVYKLATDKVEAGDYLIRRKQMIRKEAANVAAICARSIEKFGRDPELVMVQVMMQSAVNMFDASAAFTAEEEVSGSGEKRR